MRQKSTPRQKFRQTPQKKLSHRRKVRDPPPLQDCSHAKNPNQTSEQVQAGAKENESPQDISNFWRETSTANHHGDRNSPGPSSDPIGRHQTSQKTQD